MIGCVTCYQHINLQENHWLMLSWIAFTCLVGGVAVLATLSVVDLKTRLLPNELVLGFATLGIVFHLTTLAQYVSVPHIILGGIIGFSTLYLLRAAANHLYKADALGLGDVKLIGAAGIWLGPETVMLAMAAGACASLIHGLIHAAGIAKKTESHFNLSQLQIPAGPGFAIGIVLIGIWKFREFNPF